MANKHTSKATREHKLSYREHTHSSRATSVQGGSCSLKKLDLIFSSGRCALPSTQYSTWKRILPELKRAGMECDG